MKGARLTYAHHCCAFHHPEKQNRTAYEIFEREIQLECAISTPLMSTVKPQSATTKRNGRDDIGGFYEATIPRGTRNTLIYTSKSNIRHFIRRKRKPKRNKVFDRVFPDSHRNISSTALYVNKTSDRLGRFYIISDDDTFDNGFDEGTFHTSTLDPASTYVSNKTCGELVEHIKQVQCQPIPDAFNPCEDILGFTWLRVIAWFVVVTAEVGNLAVIIVTVCTKYNLSGLTVSKFLICNLAFADLTLGMYLLVLAAYDMLSKGQYFTYAIPWQYHGGCQLAGFLATFSTCLSTFSLTAITYERWCTISYAMNPNKHVTLRQAAIIMLCGWTFSVIMAVLPLLGVSNFSKTSICLPMETTSPTARGYVTVLMLGNAGFFVVICVCYADIYCKVRTKNTTSAVGRSDAIIAKRMAFLVFTDFMCLFPIVFFGLTAAMGYPLIDVTESKMLLVIFFPLNACANPFLYVLATKHFRQDFVSMISRCGFCERQVSEYRLAMVRNPFYKSKNNNQSSVTHDLIQNRSVNQSQAIAMDTTETSLSNRNGSKISSHLTPKERTAGKINNSCISESPVLNGYIHNCPDRPSTSPDSSPGPRNLSVVIDVGLTSDARDDDE
jgi:hypothetical protein